MAVGEDGESLLEPAPAALVAVLGSASGPAAVADLAAPETEGLLYEASSFRDAAEDAEDAEDEEPLDEILL